MRDLVREVCNGFLAKGIININVKILYSISLHFVKLAKKNLDGYIMINEENTIDNKLLNFCLFSIVLSWNFFCRFLP